MLLIHDAEGPKESKTFKNANNILAVSSDSISPPETINLSTFIVEWLYHKAWEAAQSNQFPLSCPAAFCRLFVQETHNSHDILHKSPFPMVPAK